MIQEHEEFEVETDRVGELPFSFCSETVKRVVVEVLWSGCRASRVGPR